MNAKDFRIGNYLKYDLGICTVRGTTKDAIWLNDEGGPVLLDGFMNIGPIPLTEEWLLKFGFEATQNKWFQINYFTDCNESSEKMGLLINLVSNRCGMIDTDNDDGVSVMTSNRIYYVHQLQNLYFALTNEELTIKED
jgi:hypothetical protein